MSFTLLTYNLLYNEALKNIDKIIKKYQPDILTLQEIETLDKNFTHIKNLGYKLADYSNSFFKHQKIYGVATFYKPDKLSLKRSSSINLPRGFYEILLFLLRGGNNPRTVLTTDFFLKSNKKNLTIYNLHLTTWGTNGVRIKQMKETFRSMSINKHPCVIAGDFNFTYGRKQFEILIDRYDLKEATNNILYTLESKFLKIFPIRLKLDYILYHHLQSLKTEKITVRFSDHYPILSEFEI